MHNYIRVLCLHSFDQKDSLMLAPRLETCTNSVLVINYILSGAYFG